MSKPLEEFQSPLWERFITHNLPMAVTEELERDRRFVAEQKLAKGADEVFVSGDSFMPNARALEPVKARMFAPVEA